MSKPRKPILMLITALATILIIQSSVSAVDEPTTQVEGSITLTDSGCKLSVFRAPQVNFGEWEWDGTRYQPLSPETGGAVSYLARAGRAGECTVLIQTDGLTHEDGSESGMIEPGHFVVKSDNNVLIHFDDNGVASVPAATRLNQQGVSLELVSVPNDISPGEYNGTFVFTISAAD